MADTKIGKKAEAKLQEWLDRPHDGYSLDRIKDQMTGFYGSKNICDFTLFKSPFMYYIESKSTWEDSFSFGQITETQYKGLLQKSKINHVYGLVIVLFTSYQRAFVFHIEDIDKYTQDTGKKSLNIRKIAAWTIPYHELRTVPNRRKTLLDYEGEIEEYV